MTGRLRLSGDAWPRAADGPEGVAGVVLVGAVPAAARQLAAHAGMVVSNAASLPAAAERLVGGRRTVVAVPASEFRADAVQELLGHALALDADVGFAVGDTPSTWSTALAAALDSLVLPDQHSFAWFDEDRDPPLGGTGVVHADQTAEASLVESWDLMILRGHGDGSHLKVGTTILCGRRGDVETVGGRPVADGCRAAGPATLCKRSRVAGWTAVPASAIRARVIVLLSCNSLATDGALYPSAGSIALGMVDGGARCVLGTTRAVEFDDLLIERIVGFFRDGLPVGRVATLLNRELALRGQEPAYAILGTTDARVVGLRPLSIIPARDGQPVWDVDDDAAADVFLSEAGALVRTGRSRAAVDRAAAVREAQDELDAIGARAAAAARWEFSLRMLLADSQAAAKDLGGLLAARSRVEDTLHMLNLAVSQAWSTRRYLPEVDQGRANVRSALDAWSAAAAGLTLSTLIHEVDAERGRLLGDRALLSLLLGTVRRAAPLRACDRCTSRMAVWQLQGPAPEGTTSTLLECPVCGPRSLAGDLRLGTRLSGPLRRGRSVRLQIDAQLIGPAATAAAALAVVQVRDKSRMAPVLTRAVELSDGRATLEVPVDAAAGPDMWSVRVLAFRAGAVAYDRRVVECVTAG